MNKLGCHPNLIPIFRVCLHFGHHAQNGPFKSGSGGFRTPETRIWGPFFLIFYLSKKTFLDPPPKCVVLRQDTYCITGGVSEAFRIIGTLLINARNITDNHNYYSSMLRGFASPPARVRHLTFFIVADSYVLPELGMYVFYTF